MACDQDQILSWSTTWDDFLTVPYNKAKKQDGLHDRMKMYMVRCSDFVAWDLIQSVHTEASALAEDAQPLEAVATELDAEHVQEAGGADWWQQQDQWHDDTANDQAEWSATEADDYRQNSQRHGFEPKVISLLVNFYRYTKDQRGKAWDKLFSSANSVYNARANVNRQVNRILKW